MTSSPTRSTSVQPASTRPARILSGLPAGVLAAALTLVPATLGAQESHPSEAPSILARLSDGAELVTPPLDPSVPAPAAVLGYPVGVRFTQHHRVLEYLRALADASDRVTLWQYGETYEGRPLTLLAISSPDNLRNLERIRQDQLHLADPDGLDADERRRLLDSAPVIVWLGYGVHGNESSSTEAAMVTAYVLAAGGGAVADQLDNTVVLLDPLLNPDGRERYVHGFVQRRGRQPDSDPDSYEHGEPWPGGRFNHYLFDLNRDWAWATQLETRHRLAAYRQWEPHVFVDLHEMGRESTYFFPPSAAPIHDLLDTRLQSWLDAFGRGNAAAFERQGWIYFKAEYFDLFYPGYGDSYPGLRQAIGMTYEMAGGGRAGQSVDLSGGGTLTLADRAARHATSSLATVATAASQRRQLLDSFVDGRHRRPAERTYLWPAEQPEGAALAELLDRHGVSVQRLERDLQASARRLDTGQATTADSNEAHTFPAGTYAVSTDQPLGELVEALLQREATLSADFIERQQERRDQHLDLEFYDITAWSLPLAYGVETWRIDGLAADLTANTPTQGGLQAPSGTDLASATLVAHLIPPQGLAGYRLAAELQRTGVRHRLALLPFRLEGRDYPAGTLIVPRRGNGDNLAARLHESAARLGVHGQAVTTGYSDSGPALGSDNHIPVSAPRIGLLAGGGISPTGHGSLWHLLDEQIGADHSRLDVERLGSIDLDTFDVLILPSGFYSSLGDSTAERLGGWLRRGGLLIAIGNAQGWLASHDLTSVKALGDGEDDSDSPRPRLARHTTVPDVERSMYIPGAAVAGSLSSEHPLAAGLDAPPATLAQGDRVLLPSGDPRLDVLRVRDLDPILAGFTWPEATDRLAGSLLVGVESVGAGRIVVFAQDPTFRGFWRATMPLLLNSVLYGPSLVEAGKI